VGVNTTLGRSVPEREIRDDLADELELDLDEAGELGPLDELARQFAPRVDYFARRVARQWMLGQRWSDELASAGYWGLAMALANRRPDASGPELSAYVSQRIEGAVQDEARRCLRRIRWQDVDLPPVEASGDGGGGGEWSERLVDPGISPEEIAEQRRARLDLDSALAELPAEERRLVHWYMHGDSLAEIAVREDVPVGTLRVRFDRATRRLRGRTSAARRARRDLES